VIAVITAAALNPLELGRRDWIAYWSAFRLLHLQLNPYAPADLQMMQSSVPGSVDLFMPFRSPPYTLVGLGPVLALPWDLCIRLWFCISIFSVGLLLDQLRKIFGSLSRIDTALIVLAIQQPIAACLYWGQLGIVQAVAGAYLFRKNRSQVVTAIALAILLCKPHPFYLFLLVWAVQCDLKKEINAGAICAAIIGALSLAAYIIHPHGFGLWWEGLSALRPFDLMKPTLIDWARLFLLGVIWAESLSWIVPATMIALTLLLSKRIRSSGSRALALSIPLSFLTAPYCWHHDMALLAIPAAALLSVPRGIVTGRCVLGALAVLQFAAAGLQSAPHVYVFVPLILFLALLVFQKQKSSGLSTGASLQKI